MDARKTNPSKILLEICFKFEDVEPELKDEIKKKLIFGIKIKA